MAAYRVNPLNYGRALSLVLTDARPKTDALFIHGSPAASDEIDNMMLALGAIMIGCRDVNALVINGLSDEACTINGQRLAYPGCDTWGKTLTSIGVADFMMIPPSKHTALESDNVIKLASEMKWDSVTIMSYPHHILRCMLQMVFCLARAKSSLKVYARTLPSIPWQMVAEKGVLNQAPFSGTLIEAHMKEEFDRLIMYADRDCFMTTDGTMVSEDQAGPNDKRKYTPHATLEELIRYYALREQV